MGSEHYFAIIGSLLAMTRPCDKTTFTGSSFLHISFYTATLADVSFVRWLSRLDVVKYNATLLVYSWKGSTHV